jgi:DNA (cytosine-5)-methyltransferase 1
MLTPRECARLQGFPENYILHKNKTPAYHQLGNAVSVPVVKIIAKEIIKYL